MDFPIDLETSKFSPGAQHAVDTVKEALRKTGHVAEIGLEDAAKAAVIALLASDGVTFGGPRTRPDDEPVVVHK